LNKGSVATIGFSILAGVVGVPTIKFGFYADMSACLFLITSLWTDCVVSYVGIRSGVDQEGSAIVRWVVGKIGKFAGLFGPNALMTPFCFVVPWPLAIVAGTWRFSCAVSWALPFVSKRSSGLLNRMGCLSERI
jgi:hypothetical protein